MFGHLVQEFFPVLNPLLHSKLGDGYDVVYTPTSES